MQLSLKMYLPNCLHFHNTAKKGSSMHNICLAPFKIYISSRLNTIIMTLEGQSWGKANKTLSSTAILIKSISYQQTYFLASIGLGYYCHWKLLKELLGITERIFCLLSQSLDEFKKSYKQTKQPRKSTAATSSERDFSQNLLSSHENTKKSIPETSTHKIPHSKKHTYTCSHIHIDKCLKSLYVEYYGNID